MKFGLYLLACGVGASLGCFAVAESNGLAWEMTGFLPAVGRAAILIALLGAGITLVAGVLSDERGRET